MLNKKDPLISAIQKVMQGNQTERNVVDVVNEKFGITDRRALPRERQGEWDVAYQSLLNESKEALHPNQQKLDVHEPEKDKLTKHDFKKLRAMGEEKKMKGDDPCWDNYEMIGMKKGKGGKPVPNCVPVSEEGDPSKAIRGDVVTGGSSVTSVAPKEKSVTPSDQSALKKKIQSVIKEASEKQKNKVGKVMGEFKKGSLHSGKGGPVVKSRKQAIAIALDSARKMEESFFANQINEKTGVPLNVRQQQQQAVKNTNMTNSRLAREPKEAPSSFGTKIKQGLGAVDAGVRRFANDLGGEYVAAAGDYAVKNTLGRLSGMSQGTTFSKELEQEKQKTKKAEVNYPKATAAGGLASDVSTAVGVAGLGKSAVKYGIKKFAKTGTDDVAKAATSTVDDAAKATNKVDSAASKVTAPSGTFAANLQKARQQAQGARAGGSTVAATQTAGRAKMAQQAQGARAGGSTVAATQTAGRAKMAQQAQGARAGGSTVQATQTAAKASKAQQSSQALGGFGKLAAGAVNAVKKYPKLAAGAAGGAALGGFAATQLGNKPPASTAGTTPPKAAPIKVSDTEVMNSPEYKKAVASVGGNEGAKKIMTGKNVVGLGRFNAGDTITSRVRTHLAAKKNVGRES